MGRSSLTALLALSMVALLSLTFLFHRGSDLKIQKDTPPPIREFITKFFHSTYPAPRLQMRFDPDEKRPHGLDISFEAPSTFPSGAAAAARLKDMALFTFINFPEKDLEFVRLAALEPGTEKARFEFRMTFGEFRPGARTPGPPP